MQNKLKISALFLALILLMMPLTMAANAMTFDSFTPSFGLYCKNQSADIHGKVKYVVDENGKVEQYSEYTISGTNELNIEIPFISNAYELPKINITINGKSVTGKMCYGEKYYSGSKLHFYSSDIDDNLIGTLYTITADNENLTVDFKTYGKQSFIYLLPYNNLSQPSNGEYSYSLNNAQPNFIYHIFVINGEFAEFKSNAKTTKETLYIKEYIDRYFADVKYYYLEENITHNLLYALINKAIENNINYDFFDFFFNSFSESRINAYKIDLHSDTDNNIITYSLPVDIQKSNAFNSKTFITGQTATGNYNIDYTIQLNSKLPYIIESSANIEKQGNYIYTAKNVSEDFYFVFSSSENPESIYENNVSNNSRIVLFIILGVAACFIIALIIIAILHCKKRYR